MVNLLCSLSTLLTACTVILQKFIWKILYWTKPDSQVDCTCYYSWCGYKSCACLFNCFACFLKGTGTEIGTVMFWYRLQAHWFESTFILSCKIASVILCYLLASLFTVGYFLFAVASDSNFRNHSVLVSENACAQFLHL